jgi:hypothetical protein
MTKKKAIRSERERQGQRRWRAANPEKIKAGSKRYWAKIQAWREAGGPEWEAYQAKRLAWFKEHYRLNRQAESERHKARWKRDGARKLAERRAKRLANPELFKAKEEARWRNQRNRVFYCAIKTRAKKAGIGFDLTREWIAEKLRAGVCEMSGIQFDMEGKLTPNSPSIDRIDPSGPYTQANCRVILWFLNRALCNYGEDYALMVFERVLARRKPKLKLAWVA